MAHANHSSSKLRNAVLWMAALSLTGCAGQSLLGDGLRLTTHDNADDIVIAKSTAEPLPLKQTIVEPDAKREIITPVASVPAKRPAWCEYLEEDTAAQTTLMRSPNLSGSMMMARPMCLWV
jgi:hypothetical protein